jgi:hypothetical protein
MSTKHATFQRLRAFGALRRDAHGPSKAVEQFRPRPGVKFFASDKVMNDSIQNLQSFE